MYVFILCFSMGGHGALLCTLKNPGRYRSVSAFAPICNPTQCGWGQKAFSGYLGDSKEDWQEYDACCLIKKYDGPPLEILIDQACFIAKTFNISFLGKYCYCAIYMYTMYYYGTF